MIIIRTETKVVPVSVGDIINRITRVTIMNVQACTNDDIFVLREFWMT